MPMKKPIVALLCLLGCLPLVLSGCREKEVLPVYQVPAEVEPYVQQFLREAQSRGHDIRITNLKVEWADADPAGRCGICHHATSNPSHQKRITLFRNCWDPATAEAREALVFHELGHCILNRLEHKIDRLSNGVYASVMNPSDIAVYERCIYDITGNLECDKRNRRNYYVDELFDENTPEPDWAK